MGDRSARPYFSGLEEHCELWKMKFIGHCCFYTNFMTPFYLPTDNDLNGEI